MYLRRVDLHELVGFGVVGGSVGGGGVVGAEKQDSQH